MASACTFGVHAASDDVGAEGDVLVCHFLAMSSANFCIESTLMPCIASSRHHEQHLLVVQGEDAPPSCHYCRCARPTQHLPIFDHTRLVFELRLGERPHSREAAISVSDLLGLLDRRAHAAILAIHGQGVRLGMNGADQGAHAPFLRPPPNSLSSSPARTQYCLNKHIRRLPWEHCDHHELFSRAIYRHEDVAAVAAD